MKFGGVAAAWPGWVLLAALLAMTSIAHTPAATAFTGGGWWDWQETSARGWRGLGAPAAGPVFGYRPLSASLPVRANEIDPGPAP